MNARSYCDFRSAPGDTVAHSLQNQPIDLQGHIDSYAKGSPESGFRESKVHGVPAAF
jgi:hypothetical protein